MAPPKKMAPKPCSKSEQSDADHKDKMGLSNMSSIRSAVKC